MCPTSFKYCGIVYNSPTKKDPMVHRSHLIEGSLKANNWEYMPPVHRFLSPLILFYFY